MFKSAKCKFSHPGYVAQCDEADDGNKNDIRMNLLADQLVLAEECEGCVKNQPDDRQKR